MKRRQLISKLALIPMAAPLALATTNVFASSFEDFMKAQQAGVDEIKNELESYKEDYLRAFDDYKAQLEQEWQNPESRLYCAIAAYNTGTGNVAKAFIGRASMQSAYRTINSMPPESVFQVLKHHLPYKETRKYIVKVTKHLENYRTLLA